VQHFIFRDVNDDPFWMTERIRAERKEDKVVAGMKKVKKFTKAELMDQLQGKGILTTGTYRKKEVCNQSNIFQQKKNYKS
jgi:hypothetical protein